MVFTLKLELLLPTKKTTTSHDFWDQELDELS
jgi:hypothetical protein